MANHIVHIAVRRAALRVYRNRRTHRACAVARTAVETMPDTPVPPYPAPDNPLLRHVVEQAIERLESGETDILGAVRYAALHGWLEGHLEGEGCEADCRHNERWQDLRYPDDE